MTSQATKHTPVDSMAIGPRTNAMIARAKKDMSSRQSNVRALREPSIFVDHGQGQRVWDAD